MSKYIDAEKLKVLIREWYNAYKLGAHSPFRNGKVEALKETIELIDSLQQEQPGLPGIDESGVPGKDYIPVEWVDACENYGKWKIVKQEQPEVDLEKEIDKFLNETGAPYVWCNDDEQKEWCNIIARHFYELGNARKEE